jgi:tyrosyl-tRNA synthetase
MKRKTLFAQIRRFCALPEFKSEYLNVLKQRGYLYQCTDYQELDRLCQNEQIIAYLGFDATAPSLHVGSLVQIMMLRHLQKCGHKPIVLIGGGTSKIGDPSGKDETRSLLSTERIEDNARQLGSVFEKFLTFGNNNSTDAILVNNATWLDHLKYLDFLREYGRYMSVNRMLSFESVKQRLNREQPFSFLEFNYMLLQAYDFIKLNETQGVTVQLGGSDQWGNIVCGVELARKTTKTPLFGLTAPLISTSDGKKMGKSVSGAIWLDKTLLSEYDYWQFWRNTPDADVIRCVAFFSTLTSLSLHRFLKLFTDIPLETIEREYAPLTGSELNQVKLVLADEATSMLHGADCLSAIHATASSLYSSASSSSTSAESVTALPQKEFTCSSLQLSEFTLVDLLIATEITTSKNESRRCIDSGSIRVDGVKVIDPLMTIEQLSELSLENGNPSAREQFKLSNGKKKHYLIQLRSHDNGVK